MSIYEDELRMRTLPAIPTGCDCVWTVYTADDGRKAGSIFIASNKCMRYLMHPRTFCEPNHSPSTGEASDG